MRLYSYQGETTKIAINKVQTDGETYFVADVWIKNIDAFHMLRWLKDHLWSWNS